MSFVTESSVRRTVGIDSSQISGADVADIIAEVEPQVERYLNTTFTPKTRIEVKDGNGTTRIFTEKNPLMTVRELKIDGTTEDPAHLLITRGSGKIELNTNGSLSTSTFTMKQKCIIIKYVYGWLEESTVTTTTTAASTAGTSVTLSVADICTFAADDWIDIYGMDGYKESAKITATDTGEITVDQLVYSHESGSIIYKLQISPIVTKLMNVVCALAMVARIIGQSYTDIVGYTMVEFSVQKGEPYTQWRETAQQLIKERDELIASLRPRPSVVV